MVTIKPGFEKRISDELYFKVAETPEEGQLLADFNAALHGEELQEYVLRLYSEHPYHKDMLWFYIEDRSIEGENKIVSSAALLPLEWKILNTKITVAEMGFVGTLEDYRGQSLFGIINSFYEDALKEKEIILTALVGIPYYYSRFGYIFSLDRLAGYTMPTGNIPSTQIDEVKVRKATEDDLETIEGLYDEYNKKFAVSTVFDDKMMQFRLMNSTCDLLNSITYIIEEDRKPRAFFSIGSLNDSNRADITLVSSLTYRQMIKMLQFVKNYNPGNVTSFKVNVLPSSNLGQFLHIQGADPIRRWLWQIKIPDILLFFKSISPVLEYRLNHSIFRGITQKIKISNYSVTMTINIEEGKIMEITNIKEYPSSDVDLRIPSPYLLRLFFSDRSVEEIAHIISDTIVKPESSMLIETLFPKQASIPFSWYE